MVGELRNGIVRRPRGPGAAGLGLGWLIPVLVMWAVMAFGGYWLPSTWTLLIKCFACWALVYVVVFGNDE